MKKLSIILIVLFVAACSSRHYSPGDFDTSAINAAAQKVMRDYPVGSNLNSGDWPQVFLDIQARSVLVRDNGVYLKLRSFLAEEKGLFIPRPGMKVDLNKGSDPSYQLLGNDVYSYRIKG